MTEVSTETVVVISIKFIKHAAQELELPFSVNV